MGNANPFKFSIILGVPLRLIGIHFDHCKIKLRFPMFCLFHRPYKGYEVTVGSEEPLNFFFPKGISVQEGSSGTHFDHGQFEINTFLI